MPEIVAYYGSIRVIGRNAKERPSYDKKPPSKAIHKVAPLLREFMDKLQKEYRSAYACAEAQALAKILLEIAPGLYGEIRFTRPTGYAGVELWNPCGNCSEWLEVAEGWGPDVKYKLSQAALNLLPRG